MPRQDLAIALCRVSSDEQLLNNSLKRQRDSVIDAAKKIGVIIPKDGWWSGSVSSKKGNNLKRQDIKEMLEYCSKHKSVKYLIVDEPDRFMRSIREAFYFEMEFEKLNVKVWYASDPVLNSDDLMAKMYRFMKYFVAEGDNDARETKAIMGQTQALKEGRYPFAPKPGYRKGYETAIQEIDEVKGPALKLVLEKIANKLITPSQGLIELNNSDFMSAHSEYKMDKFRKIITDPFYAGILEVNKQVKVYNENGLHEPLITKEQHLELVKIMDSKQKVQSGPLKDGNPKYPLNNLITCLQCSEQRNGRLVGLDLNNGKDKSKVYEKYRCRACNRYLTKDEVHSEVMSQFEKNPINDEGKEAFIKALGIVWKEKENQVELEIARTKHKISTIRKKIEQKIEAVSNPSNASIAEEIRLAIDNHKADVETLESKLEELQTEANANWEEFLRYAYDFIEDMGTKFLSTSKENRLRCKQVVFPAGFYVDENKKVYTPEISDLIRLIPKKKDTEVSENSQLVQYLRKSLHPIMMEVKRWREILDVPFHLYLINK